MLKALATAKVILRGMTCCSRSPSLLSSVSSAHSHGSLSNNLYDVFFTEIYQKNVLVVCAGNCFCIQLKLNVRGDVGERELMQMCVDFVLERSSAPRRITLRC